MKEYEIIDINHLLSSPIKVQARTPREAAEKALMVKVKRNDKGSIVVYGKYESGRYGYIVKSFVYEVEE